MCVCLMCDFVFDCKNVVATRSLSKFASCAFAVAGQRFVALSRLDFVSQSGNSTHARFANIRVLILRTITCVCVCVCVCLYFFAHQIAHLYPRIMSDYAGQLLALLQERANVLGNGICANVLFEDFV
jgi:ABC-type Fe3+ transport system permease subunit